MSAAKKQTKQDLENKIAELEAKLDKLATQLEAKPTAPKPAEVKPAETKPTAPKPAEVKPSETKPTAPKPAETTAQPPLTIQAALENAY
ncbi:MAG: trans-sialidase, partial [Nitrosarchaeum sp.]|nr:trans-sialidase [Nitrosarchaeum sp.]